MVRGLRCWPMMTILKSVPFVQRCKWYSEHNVLAIQTLYRWHATSTRKKRVYLTSKRVAALFREAAKAIHPNMSKDKLLRYSAHSLQVWACVLLDEAGMSPEFIMSRLRWMGNFFECTSVILV